MSFSPTIQAGLLHQGRRDYADADLSGRADCVCCFLKAIL